MPARSDGAPGQLAIGATAIRYDGALMTTGGDDAFDSLLRGVAASPAVTLPPRRFGAGDVLAERFVIHAVAGCGGMGTVYRATDRVTGQAVALKIVAAQGHAEHARFAQEARVLAELAHPAIVGYVAHGTTGEEQPFLAMEWLDGEDLARRLARAGLAVEDSVTLALRAAQGLAAAHARGVVHRDVKPSNLFLVDGEPSRAKVLDFGIARLQASGFAPTAQPLTRTGALVGTIGYMSPEQAIADKKLDARTDVFALGCVLFECLTGRPAFVAEHAVAVLAKVLREPAPRLRAFRPELPESLDALVARMLSKEREGRPPDGEAVARELLRYGSLRGGLPGERPPDVGLSHGEQRLVSVLLAMPEETVADETAGPPAAAIEIVRRSGGTPAWIADGVLLVTWDATSPDQALTASRCAIALHRGFVSARVAVATGRAQSRVDGPPGSVIDQASSLLASSTSAGVVIDGVTAGLLGPAFDVGGDGSARKLIGARAGSEASRMLLGKETPCVGRDKELTLLGATLQECIEDSVPRAVLVTGPAGQGKSRVADEMVSRARARRDVRIWTARGDPVGAGSAFVLARQLLRQAAAIRESDPPAQRRAQLVTHLARYLHGAELAHVAEFLGELEGAPAEIASPPLLAARNDARIMADQMRRAFQRWLIAESTRPLLIVLEDLHWGDAPTVLYLGDVLRSAGGAPIMLLALARPEVHEAFPKLHASLDMQEIRLGPLTRRAVENLVRAALGQRADPESVARIVERGAGNPFYIEELIRRAAEGRSETLPETVLALAQSRLERLDADARRVLRAASVFGEVFWEGAVASLVGGVPAQDVGAWLGALVTSEVIVPGRGDRFLGETEYAFRHALLRDAAYAMLTEADRRAGHRLAADWLERAGERDALLLADHHERAGNSERAASFLAQAALAALDGGDLSYAATLADRGLVGGAAGEIRGTLRLVQMLRTGFRGEYARDAAQEAMREAMDLLPRGGARWFQAASVVTYAAATTGEAGLALRVVDETLALETEPAPTGPYAEAMHRMINGLRAFGQYDLATELLRRFERAGATSQAQDPVFAGYLHLTRVIELLSREDLQGALENAQRALAFVQSAGDAIGCALATYTLGHVEFQIGDFAAAEARALEAIEAARRAGAPLVEVWARIERAGALVHSGRAAEGLAIAKPLLETFDRLSAQSIVADAELRLGDIDAAERNARAVLDGARETHAIPWIPILAAAVLARVAIDLGQAREALRLVEEGMVAPMREAKMTAPRLGSLLRLLEAEATHALDPSAARALIAQARVRIERLAASLEDPRRRQAFLSTEENARTLALAQEWLERP
jgi:tetratricopeptide (TPR) repeat protein